MPGDPDRFRRLMSGAAQRGGVITIAHAAADGVDRRTLARLEQRGFLVRHSPGLYLPAGHTASPRDEIVAAVAATGGVVSYESAAMWWGHESADRTTHVTVSHRRRPRSRENLRVHSTTRSLSRITTVRDGLRVTTPAQTLLDLCVSHADEGVPRAFLGHCLSNRLLTASQLDRFLRQQPKRAPGTRRMRALAELPGGGTVDSLVELELVSLLAKAGIPRPKLQHVVKHEGRFVGRVDCAWPDLWVALEIDGYRHHSDRWTFVNDRTRQNALVNAGWTVLRTTPTEIRRDASTLLGTLARALARARDRAA